MTLRVSKIFWLNIQWGYRSGYGSWHLCSSHPRFTSNILIFEFLKFNIGIEGGDARSKAVKYLAKTAYKVCIVYLPQHLCGERRYADPYCSHGQEVLAGRHKMLWEEFLNKKTNTASKKEEKREGITVSTWVGTVRNLILHCVSPGVSPLLRWLQTSGVEMLLQNKIIGQPKEVPPINQTRISNASAAWRL